VTRADAVDELQGDVNDVGVGGGHDEPVDQERFGSGGHVLLNAELVGSMPAPARPVVAGINSGGASWVNEPSRVRVRDDGSITVRIHGLVIPPPRGAGINPIALVVATLVCDQQVKASTTPYALSAAGDGSTRDMIAVPRHCDDPVVLIQPAAIRAVYIASTLEHARSDGEHDD
jgi:hypothetical protein